MAFDRRRVSTSLKNGPARNNLITDLTLAIEILGIYNTTIQSIGKSLTLMRSIFVVLVMVFTNTLDFQKSLKTAKPGVINF
jgi:hypothetical protein